MKSDIPLRIVYFRRDDTQYVPDHEDATYLGHLCENLLFRGENLETSVETLQKYFLDQLDESIERTNNLKALSHDSEVYMGSPFVVFNENTPILDPSEEIDETNWHKKGLFRHIHVSNYSCQPWKESRAISTKNRMIAYSPEILGSEP